MQTKDRLEYSLEMALRTALDNAGPEGNALPQFVEDNERRSQWRPGEPPLSSVIWVHEDYGIVRFETLAFHFLDPKSRGKFTWAQVDAPEGTKSAGIHTALEMLNPGVIAIWAQGPQAGTEAQNVTLDGVPNLSVNVKYFRKNVPQTRMTDKDNFDLFLIRPDGRFMQLQVAILTRNGRWVVSIHEVFAGQILRTNHGCEVEGITSVGVGSHKAIVIPSESEYAYPGCDWLGSYSFLGPKVVKMAVEHKCVSPLANATIAKWNPCFPKQPVSKKWAAGIVQWYNPILGFGFVIDQEGNQYFLHRICLETGGVIFGVIDLGSPIVFGWRQVPQGQKNEGQLQVTQMGQQKAS